MKNLSVMAVYGLTNTASVQILECNDEFIYYLDPLGKPHHAKIYTDTSRAYFRYCGGFRIHLDECLRV